MRLGIYIPLFIVLFACTNLQKSKQLEELDKIQSKLNAFLPTDFNEQQQKAETQFQISQSKLDSIEKYYNGQIIDLKLAQKLDSFKMNFAYLHTILAMQEYLLNTITQKQNDLKQLETDLKNASGVRHKYQEYINFEKKEVENVSQSILQYEKIHQNQQDCFDATILAVNRFIVSLKDSMINQSEI